jgi:hypothetical protein
MRRSLKGKNAASEPSPEMQNFETAMKQILSVSKDELDRREAEYRKSRDKRKH